MKFFTIPFGVVPDASPTMYTTAEAAVQAAGQDDWGVYEVL